MLGKWTLNQLSAIFSLETRAIPAGTATVTLPVIQSSQDDTAMLAALVGSLPALPAVKAKPARKLPAPRKVRKDAALSNAVEAHQACHKLVVREDLQAITVKGYRG